MCRRVALALLGLLAIALILVAILVVLVRDFGGWGTFALDIAKAAAVQLVVALVLLAVVLAVLQYRSRDPVSGPPRPAVRAAFVLAPVLVLPVLPIVFKRPIDVYDGIQTLVLVFIFLFVAGKYGEDFWRALPMPDPWLAPGPAPPDPPGPVTPVQGDPPHVPVGSSKRLQDYTEDDLEKTLLNMVMQDRATVERLVAYERERAPFDSRKELLWSAIQRLERDRR